MLFFDDIIEQVGRFSGLAFFFSCRYIIVLLISVDKSSLTESTMGMFETLLPTSTQNEICF